MVAVALPALAGPIEVDPASQPFRGVSLPSGRGGLHGLEIGAQDGQQGYAEEEFFLSGTAAGADYRTHLLVRRPADPDRFSGTVVLEVFHAAGTAPLWMFREYLVSRGHGYAVVNAQHLPLENLAKPSDPARYGSLAIGGPAGARPVAHAITAQAAVLVRDSARSPFGPGVRCVILGGVSQTGLFTLDFISEAHREARLIDGAPVFDGYFPLSAPGAAPVPAVGVPVIHMPNEGDFLMMADGFMPAHLDGPFGYRRDDADTAADRYRLYELAGCAHIPTWHVSAQEFSAVPGLAEAVLPGDRLAQFPGIMYRAAALDNLWRWVTAGTAPPRAERLRLTGSGEIRRDQHGNAVGGVRSSHLDVPVATYIARAPDAGPEPGLRRSQLGIEAPFSADKLAELYGSSREYAQRTAGRLDELVRERWLLPEDAAVLAAEAAENEVTA
ncbi:MAG TPA: alpha/beta hydrolase domain-containing protein [Trebonia sp.]|nr:alpha/beta hydrolase domain-containing protein [Trebonia sp.]